MELQHSTIHRHLDTKLKIMGLEVHDLLFVLIIAAVMNLVFGNTFLSFYLVFLLPACLTALLYFGKRGKPDGYLIHLIQFYLSPGIYLAGEDPEDEPLRRKEISY